MEALRSPALISDNYFCRFGDVWDAEVVPLLKTDDKRVLQATTLIELLQERHPGQFIDGQARTLQRRLRDWRAVNGPTQEVFFEQRHVAGREAAVDFTHATELGVTIRGVLLEHLLFEFVMSFSGWTWVCLAFGETYEALVFGIQGALAALGGAPQVLRSDNLSAATHELRRTGGRALVPRFKAVLDHYGMSSTRIQPSESHENGVVEQRHRRTKRALAEALVIRGSTEFDTIEEYTALVVDIIDRRNRKFTDATVLDRAALRPLGIPSCRPSPTTSTNGSLARLEIPTMHTARFAPRTISIPIFTWREVRTMSRDLVVHYKRSTYLIRPTDETRAFTVAKRQVDSLENASGVVEIRHEGRSLPYSVYDQQPIIAPGEIVENKRLGAALAVIRTIQDGRDAARLASRKVSLRAKDRIREARACVFRSTWAAVPA